MNKKELARGHLLIRGKPEESRNWIIDAGFVRVRETGAILFPLNRQPEEGKEENFELVNDSNLRKTLQKAFQLSLELDRNSLLSPAEMARKLIEFLRQEEPNLMIKTGSVTNSVAVFLEEDHGYLIYDDWKSLQDVSKNQ